jgi:hypothetical protein
MALGAGAGGPVTGGRVVGGFVEEPQCSADVPHQPNFEQQVPSGQTPSPTDPLPHVPVCRPRSFLVF